MSIEQGDPNFLVFIFHNMGTRRKWTIENRLKNLPIKLRTSDKLLYLRLSGINKQLCDMKLKIAIAINTQYTSFASFAVLHETRLAKLEILSCKLLR